MSQVENTKRLITKHHRRLQKLKEQQALFGLGTPAEVLLEIEDIEDEIEELEKQLKAIKRSAQPSEKTVSTEVPAILPTKRLLANITRIPLRQIDIQARQSNVWCVELPSAAAEQLLTLHQQTDPVLNALKIGSVKVIHHQRPQAPVSAPSKLPTNGQRANGTQHHPLQISLAGNAVKGVMNEMQLVVNNSSVEDFQQVSIQLEIPHNGISLEPVEVDFPLRAKASVSIPITLFAYQAGPQTIEAWASSIPAPKVGFLHETLSLAVERPQAKSVLEVELL